MQHAVGLNTHLTANLLRNLLVIFFKSVKIDRIMVMSLWPRFFGPLCKASYMYQCWSTDSFGNIGDSGVKRNPIGWRRGVLLVSGVRRMNDVNVVGPG